MNKTVAARAEHLQLLLHYHASTAAAAAATATAATVTAAAAAAPAAAAPAATAPSNNSHASGCPTSNLGGRGLGKMIKP
jgi:hypothetical protein